MRHKFSVKNVPDAIWESDNPYGIPRLDINLQANALDQPAEQWMSRAQGRKRKQTGTYLFYVDDEKFTALWRDPSPLINSACVTVGELNYTLTDDTPRALGLYQTYKKRWISRFLQSEGIRIMVDMNVSQGWQKANLLGIPHGWKAYSTRGYTHYLDNLISQYHLAQNHSGVINPLFVVYGGGIKVRQLCQDMAWIHVAEQRDEINERKTNKG
jgi:hypothetical protein